MRYVVQVRRRGFDPSRPNEVIHYGPFKSEDHSHRLAAAARKAGADANVLPIIPGNRYCSTNPFQPKEDPRA